MTPSLIALKCLLPLVDNEYLIKRGYFESWAGQKVEDANGNPVPFFTYPAIELLQERVTKDLNIFEFGSGYGTIWWAKHAKQISVVEHSRAWYEKMKPVYPANVHYIYCKLIYGGDYSSMTVKLKPIKFDIIVVDGRDRINCMYKSVHSLTERGVMILDNSNRDYYNAGRDYIKYYGYKELRLYGMTPMITHENATSFFYRHDNCLGL